MASPLPHKIEFDMGSETDLSPQSLGFGVLRGTFSCLYWKI